MRGSNPRVVVKPENKYKGKPSYKISTAGKVSSGLLAGKHSEI